MMPAVWASLVNDVRTAGAARDFAAGERLIEAYQKTEGVTPQLALAVSWLGRSALAAEDYNRALRYAARARRLSLSLLEERKLDDEKKLPLALGASIEVEGQALAAQGALSEALSFLNGELQRWKHTSIRTRIQKNINLLSLEGKPAPPIEFEEYLGPEPPTLKGKVVVLFLWAHWCGDCKSQAPVLGRLKAELGDQGLKIIGVTRRYGYVAGGVDAPPDEELRYIDEVRRKHYGQISGMSVPVSGETFANYGSSTTPTLVLIDRKGIVRLYHPGKMTYGELAPKVKVLL